VQRGADSSWVSTTTRNATEELGWRHLVVWRPSSAGAREGCGLKRGGNEGSIEVRWIFVQRKEEGNDFSCQGRKEKEEMG
jgi:hypothetical protein